MENLNETLKCLLAIRLDIECGESIRTALLKYCKVQSSTYSKLLREWLFCLEQKKDVSDLLQQVDDYERAFFEILEMGLTGYGVYERIITFEVELIEKCKYEIEKEIDQLPYKLMLPLFLLQFPAYLILILGPLLNHFIQSTGG